MLLLSKSLTQSRTQQMVIIAMHLLSVVADEGQTTTNRVIIPAMFTRQPNAKCQQAQTLAACDQVQCMFWREWRICGGGWI